MRVLKNEIVKNFIRNGGLVLSCAILTVIVLPVYIHYLPVMMILWGLCWIYENRTGLSKELFRNNKAATLFLLFVIFYVWQISGLLFSESLSTGFERLFKRLSFVVFPMVLFYPGEEVKKNIRLILRLFAFGTLLYILFCFANALHHSLLIENHKWVFQSHPKDYDYENFFYGLRFSEPVHPSYLAMYIIISVLILLEDIFDRTLSFIQKSYYILTVIILIVTLYLLSARAGMLAAIIVFPAYFLLRLYNYYARWAVMAFIGMLVVLFGLIAVKNTRVSNSIDNISNQKGEIIKKDPRLLIWQSAFGVIKKHPVLGVGTGDATSKLKDEFVARRYLEGYYDNLNVHNQFLEIWLENGIIGLLIFMSILAYMTYISIKQKNVLSGLFIVTTIVFFIFETMMNRLGGVSFFALFSFLLIYSKEEPILNPQ